MFKWDPTDMTEFFGAVATRLEDGDAHSFEVSRDGLRLLVTLFEFEGAVYVSLFRDGLVEPLITIRRQFCSHVHITQGTKSDRCFEAGSPKYRVTDMGIPPLLVRGVRVYLTPQFHVELIESRYEIV
jgi:hypothetical protein